MTRVNDCLKECFIFFNVLFGLLSAVVLTLVVWTHLTNLTILDELIPPAALAVLYSILVFAVLIPFLGAYGAHNDKKWALTLFCLAVTLCAFLFLSIGTFFATWYQGTDDTEEDLRQKLPLDKANHTDIILLAFQNMFQCCGYINGYRDWGSRIPQTCLCPLTNQVSDECEVVEGSLLKASGFSLDRLAYKQPCNIKKLWNKITLGLLGISFSIAALALIGMALSMMFCLLTPRLLVARKVFNFNQPQYTPFYNLS